MIVTDLIGQLPVHPTKRYPERDIARIRRLVLHHTAGRRLARSVASQTVAQIACFHVPSDYLQEGGAPGIAYTYCVGPGGEVFKCWPAKTICWCVKGMNTSALCVAMIGNFEVEDPTPEQWDATVELFRDLRVGYGPLPVESHGEILSTACPGKNINMNRFRLEVGA